jgi:hypothetical protein
MLFLLKNLFYFNIVILKLKCNNLIFNKIMVLNASYLCFLRSRFVKNHLIWVLEDGPLIFELVLSQSDPPRQGVSGGSPSRHLEYSGAHIQ